ncbi:MAG: hypothetical protein HY465_01035 [Deltaproteobacteria bacterium]|nr:hypothetical protein [Deltaproteobacteria bacterium]
MPQNENLKTFFDPCCNFMTRVQGGAYLQRRYGVEGSIGFLYDSGAAVGAISGTRSQDQYTLLLFPAETSLVLRADYFPWRYLIPFVKAGGDAVVYRESLGSDSITGVKYGAHGAGGLEVLLTNISDSTHALRSDFGIDDLFATLEIQYSWIDSFGSTGFDLSGLLYSVGLLVQF